MNTKKALLVTGISAVVGLASIGGVVSATTLSADTTADAKTSIVDKLAERFNLDKNEVQKVFDEEKQAHIEAREAKMQEKLTQAVKDGKITESQKQAIIAKHAEMKTYMESIKDKPREERKELMQTKMEELRKWAQDNKLEEYMHFLGKSHHHIKMSPEARADVKADAQAGAKAGDEISASTNTSTDVKVDTDMHVEGGLLYPHPTSVAL